MIPLLLFVPLAVSGGGLLGLVHEHLRRKRQSERTANNANLDAKPSGDVEQDEKIAPSGNIIQIKHSECAAHFALVLSAVGLFYPPVGLIALPTIGYSAYNAVRGRYPFERERFKAPSTILTIVALIGALATGHWFLASLVLSVDLAARKWVANFTIGYHVIGGSGNDSKWGTLVTPADLLPQRHNLEHMETQSASYPEKSPASAALVTIGQLFAISDWHRLFTKSHWKGLLSSVSDSIHMMWEKMRSR